MSGLYGLDGYGSSDEVSITAVKFRLITRHHLYQERNPAPAPAPGPGPPSKALIYHPPVASVLSRNPQSRANRTANEDVV